MSGGQLARLDKLQHIVRQIEQPYRVGDGGAGFAKLTRRVLLLHAVGADKLRISHRFFDWIEILSLNVLNQRKLSRL